VIGKLGFFSLILWMVSCGRADKTAPSAHFSIATHLDTVGQAWSDQTKVVKKIVLDEQEERAELDLETFLEELSFFKKLDISRSSYLGRYKSDTLYNALGTRYWYRSKSDNLEVRKQEFTLDDQGKLRLFKSDRHFHSVVSSFEQKIEIRGDSVFLIEQQQDIPGKSRQVLWISYELLP
jgi:hypothetical protein